MDNPSNRNPNSDEIFTMMGRLRDATTQRLQDAIDQLEKSPKKTGSAGLQELAKKQQALLERLHEQAFFIGAVVSVNGDRKEKNSSVDVSFNGRIIEARPDPELELKPGDFVRLLPSSCQIDGLSERFDVGSICAVKRVVNAKFSEVDFGGSARVVLNGPFSDKLEADDRVILDSSGSIIIAKLDKNDRKFDFGERPSVNWDDIVGLSDVKAELREAIELPFTNPELCKYYHDKRIKGTFLFGPPGCGKTMLGEASATAMAKLHGNEALETGYFYVKGPEFLDMFVGVAERGIRKLFEMGEKYFAKYGYPAIIFIDEAEALLSKRGSGVSSDMEKTIVPTFLGAMNKTNSFIILASNRPDVMDPAVIRHGRIDRKMQITRPNRNDAEIILKKNFEKYPLYPTGTKAEELASYAAQEFYSDSQILADGTLPLKNGGIAKFILGDIVNGAMLSEGIAGRAVSIARRRDETAKTLTGISREDVEKAINQTYQEEKKIDHKDELREFVDRVRASLDTQALRQSTKP